MHGCFIDWITVWQVHPEHPPFNSGAVVTFDRSGATIFEKYRSARIQGSHSTACAIQSDGRSVVASGNFGRFNRSDNLFNFDPRITLARASACAEFAGLPVFSLDHTGHDLHKCGNGSGNLGDISHDDFQRGCVHLSRVDLTRNYRTGGMSAARGVIRAIQGKSVSRVKKGVGGDASVWWSNTRYMLKVYIKALEMEAHGVNFGRAYEYARDNGIIRLEVELKRRELNDLGWSDYSEFMRAWDMGNVVKLFDEYAQILEVKNMPNDSEFLDSLPQKLRVTASVFLSGADVRSLMNRATFYRYRKALLEYGIDISDERPARISTVVREVVVEAVEPPDWYLETMRSKAA